MKSTEKFKNIKSFALLTDLYELTMAYGYWKSGIHEREAVFHLFFRNNPFTGGFTIACGLQTVIDYLDNFQMDDSDIDYLASLKGNDGKPLFDMKNELILKQWGIQA